MLFYQGYFIVFAFNAFKVVAGYTPPPPHVFAATPAIDIHGPHPAPNSNIVYVDPAVVSI
ncbi:MAG: hypothetical protein LBL45_00105 [Treponema sp.]|nr:hypothetical protein [Treponema sp.]